MRRVLTFLVAGAMVLAVPQAMLAQRGGGGHGGGGGHVGGFSGGAGVRGFGGGSFSAPHAGSFSGFAPRGFSAPWMGFSPRPLGSGLSARPYAGYPQKSWSVARSPFGQLSAPAVRRGPYPGVADGRTWNGQPGHGGHSDGHRPDYHSHSGLTYSIRTAPYYPYYAWPWYGGWPYFGNWDDSGYDADTGAAATQSYAEPETAPTEEPDSRPAYQPYQAEVAAYSAPGPEPALTIVYKNGRSQQVHNYALTQTTLLLLDNASSGRTQQVSLQEIDLSATERANRAAGVDFRLPVRN